MAEIKIEVEKVTQVRMLSSEPSGMAHNVDAASFTIGSLAGVTVAQWREAGSVYTAPLTAIMLIRSGEPEKSVF